MVEYIEHMGTDTSVVDAARVSFGKQGSLSTEKDTNLIKYLAQHDHWSPFAHCVIKFRIEAPIFIARQLMKHQVGFAWNEISRRYVKTTPSVWVPEYFRSIPEGSIKQGSSDEEVQGNARLLVKYVVVADQCLQLYDEMITSGVCPEQARAILPQGTYTQWIWTGSLYAWSRMVRLRTSSSAQKETQQIANQVSEHCARLFPISWKALNEVV